MSPIEHSHEQCPAGILRLLGDYTTLRIVETLLDSGKRFTELLRTLEDTNSVTLTDRLKKLTDSGIVVRSKATIDQKSVTYELTSVGLQLTPVLDAIKKFAEKVPSAVDSLEDTFQWLIQGIAPSHRARLDPNDAYVHRDEMWDLSDSFGLTPIVDRLTIQRRGSVLFNAGSLFERKVFGPIQVALEAGRVVTVEAGADTAAVEAILDQDEGARYVGEFAIGLNPFGTKPMLDTLFDEKIDGSLHMALGNSYDDCDNTNKSQNHWDLAHIQRPDG